MNRASGMLNGFKKVSHVIFDLDGLILDTETLYTKATQNVVTPYGKIYTADIKRQIMGFTTVEVATLIVELLDLPITPDEYTSQVFEQYKILMPHANFMPDTERIYKSVIHDIARKYGSVYTCEIMKRVLGTSQKDTCQISVREMRLPITPETFNDYFNHETKSRLASVGFLPGAEKLVRHLHKNKVPIAVASSSSRDSYELKITRHKEFFSLFNHIVTGGSDLEVRKGKPQPDIFLICARRFQQTPAPADCLVLEDAPNGVQAAISAGMQCVMVPDPQIVTPEFQKNATLVLSSLNDFKPEVFGLPSY